MIIEQIELFKNGGPVSFWILKDNMQILATGTALNSNLAGQIRNSIPFSGSEAYKREYESKHRP